jgi:hypothetical protein
MGNRAFYFIYSVLLLSMTQVEQIVSSEMETESDDLIG